MTAQAQLLIVSPDRAFLQVAQRSLGALGYDPLVAGNVPRAQRLLARTAIEVLGLDSLVPAGDAERLWRAASASGSTDGLAVLFFAPAATKLLLSGLPSFFRRERDAIVSKALDRQELEREMARLLAARPRREREEIARVGSAVLDGGRHQLLLGGGGAVLLTPTEYKLLRCLMLRPGEFIAADELLVQAWGYPAGTGGPEIVRAHVSNLRRKLRDAGQDPQLLRTLPYRGYGFVAG